MKANDEKKQIDFQNGIKALWALPIIKLIVISGSIVGLIAAAGMVMKVVGNTVVHWKSMKEAINK